MVYIFRDLIKKILAALGNGYIFCFARDFTNKHEMSERKESPDAEQRFMTYMIIINNNTKSVVTYGI